MGSTKPQPRILVGWRIALALCMLIPAFFNALFFPGFGRIWFLLSAAWIGLFLLLYLVYLPLLYKRLSFSVEEERILLYSGFLYSRERCMPIRSIQFTAVHQSPIDHLTGLCTLVVTAAGGALRLPGMRPQDAQALARSLTDR